MVLQETSVPSRRGALTAALGAFLLSRAVVLLCFAVPAMLVPAPLDAPPSDRVLMQLSAERLSEAVISTTRTNDAGWYRQIATEGYERRAFDASRQANWAFFPLHPLLWAASLRAFGDGVTAAVLVPNLLFFGALFVLVQTAVRSGRDAATSSRAAYLLALMPASYFFSFPWTESLFVFLSACTFLAMYRRAWAWMALAGALAAATRLPGIFLAPAIAIHLWVSAPELRRNWRVGFAIGCMPLGAIAFMVYLYAITGNALAFSDIQTTWGRQFEVPIRAFGIIILKPQEFAVDWNLRYVNAAAALVGALAVRHFFYRKEYGFAIFLALGVLAPLMTGSLTSMTRYVTALFPVAVYLADVTAAPGRERWVLSSMITALCLMTLAFSLGLSFAAT